MFKFCGATFSLQNGLVQKTLANFVAEDIIVWDLVAESGMARLRGHVDAVTSVNFWEARWTDTADDPMNWKIDILGKPVGPGKRDDLFLL